MTRQAYIASDGYASQTVELKGTRGGLMIEKFYTISYGKGDVAYDITFDYLIYSTCIKIEMFLLVNNALGDYIDT